MENISRAEYAALRGALLESGERCWSQGVPDGPRFLDLSLRIFDHQNHTLLISPDLPHHITLAREYIDASTADGGTLVLLGAAGSGKTTLLLQIGYTLATRAREDGHRAVPLFVALSRWALRKLPFADWLHEELQRQYDLNPAVARLCLATFRLIFLLDGLEDVIHPDDRQACVQAIGEFQRANPLHGCVISCQSGASFSLQGLRGPCIAAELLPLDASQIDARLRTTDRYPILAQALATNPALYELVRTPFWLQCVADLGHHAAAFEPKSSSRDKLKFELLEATINQAFHGRRSPYSSEEARQWLAFLARSMELHGLRTMMVTDIQASWLGSAFQRWLYRVLLAVAGGLGFGLGGLCIGIPAFAVTHKLRSVTTWALLILWASVLTLLVRYVPLSVRFTNDVLGTAMMQTLMFAAGMVLISGSFAMVNRLAQTLPQPPPFVGWNSAAAWRGLLWGLLLCLAVSSLHGFLIGIVVGGICAIVGMVIGLLRFPHRLPQASNDFERQIGDIGNKAVVAGIGAGLSMPIWLLPSMAWPDALIQSPAGQIAVKCTSTLSFSLLALCGWWLFRRVRPYAFQGRKLPHALYRAFAASGSEQTAVVLALGGMLFGVVAGGAAAWSAVLTFVVQQAIRAGGRDLDAVMRASALSMLAGAALVLTGAGVTGALLGGIERLALPRQPQPFGALHRAYRLSAITWGGVTLFAACVITLLLLLVAQLTQLYGVAANAFIAVPLAFEQAITTGRVGEAMCFVLVFALGFSVPLALIIGGYYWLHHWILRLLLVSSKHMPFRYHRFLSYAADRGLLQYAGATYRFRHPELQAYVARLMLLRQHSTAPLPSPVPRRSRLPLFGRVAGIGAALVALLTLGGVAITQQILNTAAMPTPIAQTLSVATLRLAGNGAYAAIGRVSPGESITYDQIGVVDVANGRLIQVLRSNLSEIRDLTISQDGTTIAATDGLKVLIWNAISGVQQGQLELDGEQITIITDVTLSPDGTLLAVSQLDKNLVHVVDLASNRERFVLAGHPSFVQDALFSADGHRLLTRDVGGSIRLWNTLLGQQVMDLSEHRAYAPAVFSPDGMLLAEQTKDHQLRIWQTIHGRLLDTVPLEMPIDQLAFAPDTAQLAVSFQLAPTTHRLMVWDLLSKQQRFMRLLDAPASSLMWSPDASLLAVGDTTGMIWLLDARKSEFVRAFRGHIDEVRAMAFAPDGTTLTAISADETVRQWHVASGAEQRVLTWTGP